MASLVTSAILCRMVFLSKSQKEFIADFAWNCGSKFKLGDSPRSIRAMQQSRILVAAQGGQEFLSRPET